MDKVTGIKTAGVSTAEIYWGAVPFVIIQVFMVGIVIAFPQLVMHYKGEVVDPSTVEITVPGFTPMAPSGGLGGAPTLGAPNFGAPAAPPLGAPVINP